MTKERFSWIGQYFLILQILELLFLDISVDNVFFVFPATFYKYTSILSSGCALAKTCMS